MLFTAKSHLHVFILPLDALRQVWFHWHGSDMWKMQLWCESYSRREDQYFRRLAHDSHVESSDSLHRGTTELQQWFQLKISIHIKELTLSLIKSYWQTKSSYVCVFIWESVRSTTEMIWTIKPFLFSSLFACLFKEDQVPQQKKPF